METLKGCVVIDEGWAVKAILSTVLFCATLMLFDTNTLSRLDEVTAWTVYIIYKMAIILFLQKLATLLVKTPNFFTKLKLLFL